MGRPPDAAWYSREAARAKFTKQWGEAAWNACTVGVGIYFHFKLPTASGQRDAVALFDALQRAAPTISGLRAILARPVLGHVSGRGASGRTLREECEALVAAFERAQGTASALRSVVRTPDARAHGRLTSDWQRAQVVEELLRVVPNLERHPQHLVWFAIGWGLERPPRQLAPGAPRAEHAKAAAERLRVLERWKNALRRSPARRRAHSRGAKSAA